MPQSLTMLNTLRGSLVENFYPRGWDLLKIDRCCAMGLKKVTTPAELDGSISPTVSPRMVKSAIRRPSAKQARISPV